MAGWTVLEIELSEGAIASSSFYREKTAPYHAAYPAVPSRTDGEMRFKFAAAKSSTNSIMPWFPARESNPNLKIQNFASYH